MSASQASKSSCDDGASTERMHRISAGAMVEVMGGWAAPDRVEEMEGARIREGGAGSGR